MKFCVAKRISINDASSVQSDPDIAEFYEKAAVYANEAISLLDSYQGEDQEAAVSRLLQSIL